MDCRFNLNHLAGFLVATALALTSSMAAASEVCGDGVDNDADGLADNGCWPAGVTGICESPLDCARGGAVAPKTGLLYYRMPPDITPKVPRGPGIAFQRVYTSGYDPGYSGGTTDHKSPMQYRWQHNWMSWVEKNTVPDPDIAVLHDTKGQDVLFTFNATTTTTKNDGWDYYDAQVGHHYMHLRQKNTSGSQWELLTLGGTTYHYLTDGTDGGKLDKIVDTAGHTADVSYSSGQVSQVKDDLSNKYLVFEYYTTGDKPLRYVKYTTGDGAATTTRVTIEFVYTGDQLTSVKNGSTVVQTYTYTTDYLTKIEDEASNDIASITYAAASGGRVVQMDTGAGDIGYTYASSPTAGCDGADGTYVYYNRAATTACDADSECGDLAFCGGEKDLGADTGTCYAVRRCLTIDSANEDLIDAVSAETRSGSASSCPSCVGVKDYSWDTGTSGDALALDGTKSATNVWTSYERNSNGLVTKMVENDSDADASTTPAGSRITYYSYDSTFPGKLSEVRRLSELKPSGTCTAAVATDCKRTIYTWTAADGTLDKVEEKGFTYNTNRSTVAYTYTTDYTYNSDKQVTKVEGPHATLQDDTEYTYYTSSDGEKEGYVKEVKRKTDNTPTYLTTTIDVYDFWGNATDLKDPNSNYTCLSYDASYGYLDERRVAMNNQTSCATSHADDLVTEYTRDSWGRLTKLKKSLGNCVHYEHDSEGRLLKIKKRDDCNAASTGDTIEHTYNVGGLLVKINTRNASNTVKKRQEYAYGSNRRRTTAKNPVATSYKKLFKYYDDGAFKSLTHEDDLGKVEWTYDSLNRVDEKRRYTDVSTSAFDAWTITPGNQLDLPTAVEDDDSKAMDWVWDDMGRKVSQTTPDSSITTYVYDGAGWLTDKIEADGDSGEVKHVMAYDNMGRLLSHDINNIDCDDSSGSGPGPELQYVYDDAPGTCPTGADCTNQAGRLAYVKVKLWCSSSETDDTFDQETYFAYDDTGRLVQEFVEDDGGREAETNYEWDENGNNTLVTTPMRLKFGTTYGHTNNSDQDRIKNVTQTTKTTTTTLSETTAYLPFGPEEHIRHYNEISSNDIWEYKSFNLAYRPTNLHWIHSTTKVLDIDYTEDNKGRITQRDFTNGATGLDDAYYTYDELDRLLCDSASSGACPTEGSSLKTSMAATSPYTASGERNTLHHYHPSWGTHQYDSTLVSGADQIDTIDYSSNTITYSWDDRGLRTQDDDDAHTKDDRDYTYDGRGNVLTISGKRMVSGTWRDWVLTFSYDHKNRRISKSRSESDAQGFLPSSSWFYYYDHRDRLIEVKHTPDSTASSTYSIYAFYWFENRPLAYYQFDAPSKTTTRRYIHADELGRPLEVWSWPTSGDATRVWAINPDVFGWDEILVGAAVYQPLRFPGQYYDEETVAWEDNGTDPARPALHYNWHRTYDPFTGTYLQVDPKVEDTWEAYNYVEQDPVQKVDPTGLDWTREDTAVAGWCVVAIVLPFIPNRETETCGPAGCADDKWAGAKYLATISTLCGATLISILGLIGDQYSCVGGEIWAWNPSTGVKGKRFQSSFFGDMPICCFPDNPQEHNSRCDDCREFVSEHGTNSTHECGLRVLPPYPIPTLDTSSYPGPVGQSLKTADDFQARINHR